MLTEFREAPKRGEEGFAPLIVVATSAFGLGIDRPDVVVVVVDAANLERNLFLTSQVLELGIPAVVALNQVDAAEAAGIRIDAIELTLELGAPVVPTVAMRGEGLDVLKSAIRKAPGLDRPERRFELPPEADTQKVKAEFKKGILAVHAPKAITATPKKVEIGK